MENEPAPHHLAARAIVLVVAMNATAAEKTVFDFQTASNAGDWQVVNDDVMGGVSASSFRVADGVAVFRGQISLENNGGFASVRSLSVRHELAGGGAFVIRARGDGRRYKFTVRTDRSLDSAIYRAAFTTKQGEWQEHRLPIKDFVASFRGRVMAGAPPLDPAKVTSVGFLISDKQAGPFQLEVAWIRAAPAASP